MKGLSKVWCLLIVMCFSCGNHGDEETKSEDTRELITKSDIDIEQIKEAICRNFPKDLVLKYHPDAQKIEIETIDNGSGGMLHCNVKLYYGQKEYEYWTGQVSAHINQLKDPFWQYNPNRNATLYQPIEIGDIAVYISNMHQLQVLKDGVLYCITPPNNGTMTSSGIETKNIAIEIAQYYQL